MSLRETLAGLGENIYYLIRHDQVKSIVEEAREGCINKRRLIQDYIDTGVVSREQLDSMAQDKDLTKRFASIMRDVGMPGDGGYYKAMHDIESLRPVEQIAFWGFWIKYLERRFSIDTSPKPTKP